MARAVPSTRSSVRSTETKIASGPGSRPDIHEYAKLGHPRLPARVFRAFNTGRNRTCAIVERGVWRRGPGSGLVRVAVFTGIIQAVETVVRVDAAPRARDGGTPAYRLEIELGELAEGLELGASVAVNGACLTLAKRAATLGSFDVVPETWNRTTLAQLRRGDHVNLERSLCVGDPLDGHFVQGHVDGVGQVERVDRSQGQWKLWVRYEPELRPFLVPKGSVALDGTSLTLVDVADGRLSVALVPTTLTRTTLVNRRSGDRVNIETDILARLVANRLGPRGESARESATANGLTWDRIQGGGFAP